MNIKLIKYIIISSYFVSILQAEININNSIADNQEQSFKISKPFVNVGHSSPISSVSFSPDGKYALSGSYDHTLKLWDIKKREEVKTFKGHTEWVNSVSFSPDGKYALSGSDDKTLKLWDIKTGKEVKTFKGHSKKINSVSFSPDGKYALSGSWDNTLRLWDIGTGKKLKTFQGHTKWVNSVYFSPDGKYVLSGSWDKTLKLWDVKTANVLKTFKGHSGAVRCVAFSPDGKYALSGSDDKTLRLWDITTANELKTFIGHSSWVNSVDFSPNGKYALSGSWDKTLKLWDIKTAKELKTFKGDSNSVNSVSFSPDGRYALSGNWDKTLKLWDMDYRKKLKGFKGYSISINSVSFSPNNKYILSGSDDKTLKLWDINTGKVLKTFKGHSDAVRSVSFSPNNKYVLSGSWDKTLKLWDIKTAKELKTFKGHTSLINSISFSPNGKYALSGSYDQTLKLWDIKTAKELKTFKGHSDSVDSVSFSLDGRYALSGSWDKTSRLWDIKTAQELKIFKENPPIWITAVSFSPDGKYILLGDRIGVKLWDIETKNVIKTFEGHSDWIQSISFSSDGKYILSGSSDNTLKLWNIRTGQELKTFKGHSGSVRSVSFNPNNRYIISGSDDQTIKVWDIKTGKELLSMFSFEDGEWISITPDGYFNASKKGAKHLSVLIGPMEVTSVDAYYETFYRPDIVSAALQGVSSDIQYAQVQKPKLKISQIKPAPEVEIVDTLNSIDKEELQVTLKITPKEKDEYGQIRLYVDGTLIKSDNDRALVKKKDENTIYKTYTIKIVKGEHSIKALVFNKENTMQSLDALHTVVSTYDPIVKPNIYAVVVGINEYKNPTLKLKYAVPDAKLFADTIKEKTKDLFGKVEVKLLTSKADTTKENITKTLTSMQNLHPQDMFIFYVASHGMVQDAKYHMITSNVGALSTRKIKQEAISQEGLKELIANIPTTKKFVIFDTCNSGALGQALEVALLTRGLTEITAMKVLSRAVGSTIISASSSSQEALEGYKGHGLLTYVLTQGLKGDADSDKDGFVKTLEISNYVEDTVPEIAEREFKRAQYPYVSPIGQGFPLVKVK